MNKNVVSEETNRPLCPREESYYKIYVFYFTNVSFMTTYVTSVQYPCLNTIILYTQIIVSSFVSSFN